MDARGVLVGAHGVLIWHAMVHHSARGRLFSQGEGGGEVSDEDERENAVELLNKLSHVQGMSKCSHFQCGKGLSEIFLWQSCDLIASLSQLLLDSVSAIYYWAHLLHLSPGLL